MATVIEIVDGLVEKLEQAKRTVNRINSVWTLRDIQREFTKQDFIDYYHAKKVILGEALHQAYQTEDKKFTDRLERKFYSAWREYNRLTQPQSSLP
ncbi:MAG: hypothetical protein KKB21_02960 [Nanoarchaeota archaeon]|nr:hypothetical protein [Nanoarchaeota archaeon]